MADLLEALHNLARQRGRGDSSPLLALRTLAEQPGARISHLPISQRLSQAWVSLTGEPFRQHQSLSLSALRRGDPFALVGGGPAARQTLHLLAFELLRNNPQSTALLIAPDADAAARQLGELQDLSAALPAPLSVAAAQGDGLRAAFGARLVLASPAALHERLLRHHDRAWRSFWARARLLLIADAHRYDGVAAAHLAALLLRARRLIPADPPPLLGATLAAADGAADVLAQIAGQPWRMIPVDDAPRPAASLALWRAGGDRAREAVALATAMQRAGATVHITCSALEAPALRALLGADAPAASVGAGVQLAQVQVLIGAACGAAALRQAVESGARLTVLLLGDEPAERTIARLAARDPGQLPLLDDPPPAWVAAPANAYVVAQHLICAASERPLSADEVSAWQVESIVARLEQHDQLAPLPEAALAWQPLPAGGDPYAGFDLHAAGGSPPQIADDQGQALAALDPAAFDRWAFLGAALPPMRGGYRVIGRDEADLALTVRATGEGRRSFPLRRCVVRVRDRREGRELRGRELAWGRVVVDEEIYGYREVSPGGAPVERALAPVLTSSWSAPAIWLDLPMAIGAGGQLIGWSLAAAVAVRTLLSLGDGVPAYDAEARRIYMVDAQPGGNGLAAWLYDHIEGLLPLAYDIALDCRSDPLLEPLARADMDWLLALLGGSAAPLAARPLSPAVREAAAPPAAAPRLPPSVLKPLVPPAARTPPPPDRTPAPPVREPPPEPPAVERTPPVREPPAVERTPPVREPPPVERTAPTQPARTPVVREPSPVLPPSPPDRTPAPPRVERTPPVVREPSPVLPPSPPDRTPAPPRVERTPPVEPPAAKAGGRRKGRGDPAAGPAPGPGRKGRAAGPPAAKAPPPPPAPTPPAPPPAPPASEPLPDAGAMVERLRRLREQRERREPATPAPRLAAPLAGPLEPRFHAGDRVFCMPWGIGVVRSSRVSADQELLVVAFPDHGDLTIDPAVSAVRQAPDEEPEEEF